MSSPILIDPRSRFSDLELALPPQDFPVLQRDFPKSKPDSGETSYVGHGRLAGRRALITGGDSGIGRAVVLVMAREGAKVAINYLPYEEPDAVDLERLLAKEGIKIVKIPGYLLDEKFCEELVEKAAAALGGLDVLVNNAGTSGSYVDDITTYTTEQWDTVFRTNVYAGFFLVRAAAKIMPPGSSVIWTVSEIINLPTTGLHDYSASKAAVGMMVRTLGSSLFSSKGIRVNGVAPGFVYTPFQPASGVTTEQMLEVTAALPPGRPAQPVEIATIYVDLADATKTYTSGSIVCMSGGLSALKFL